MPLTYLELRKRWPVTAEERCMRLPAWECTPKTRERFGSLGR